MIIIGKTKDPHGWLGNMSAYPVIWNNKKYLTTEALFQSLRFNNEEIIEKIRSEKSPMGAKFTAKKYKNEMVIVPCSEIDIENMELCLNLKLEFHKELKEKLIATKNDFIVEDCSKRKRGSGLFWGANLENGKWIGENKLGKLWMKIRNNLMIKINI